MGWSTDDYGRNFESNPGRTITKVVLLLILLGMGVSFVGYIGGWFSEAGQVVKEEFGPRASLKKYEWFKDASATIEEKGHTIKVYEQNVKDMEESYDGIPRKDWDRIDKQQYNMWSQEITGLKASYNKVVKEYNAQSSKFNWSLYNKSDLPEHYDLYLDK
jgi:hypothetical protein